MSNNLWAIRRKSDGAYLPQGLPGHHSKTEFEDYGPPRLFVTRSGAQVSARAWLAGPWRTTLEFDATDEYGSGNYYQGTPAPIGKPRNEEIEVVRVKLLPRHASGRRGLGG